MGWLVRFANKACFIIIFPVRIQKSGNPAKSRKCWMTNWRVARAAAVMDTFGHQFRLCGEGSSSARAWGSIWNRSGNQGHRCSSGWRLDIQPEQRGQIPTRAHPIRDLPSARTQASVKVWGLRGKESQIRFQRHESDDWHCDGCLLNASSKGNFYLWLLTVSHAYWQSRWLVFVNWSQSQS